MKKRALFLYFVPVIVIFFTIYFAFSSFSIAFSERIAKPFGYSDLSRANNEFALSYFKLQAQKTSGNIFFSPFSISSAFAMLFEGAAGQTADEMRQVFGFAPDIAEQRAAQSALYDKLSVKNSSAALNIANALWIQKDFAVLQDYKDAIDQHYKALIRELDFYGDAAGSADTINSWVKQATFDKIQDLVSPQMLGRATKLVLTNAVYFKDKFEREFNAELTRDMNFATGDKKNRKTPFMNSFGEGSVYNYFEDSLLQALEIEYSGGELSMVILLPKNKDISLFARKLETKDLYKIFEGSKRRRVDVSIPKFVIESEYSLAEDLKEMKMPTVFDPGKANLSLIDGTQSLAVSAAVHKAYIEINEEGTEAAAATAIIIAKTSFDPGLPVFVADHPFIFLIRHKATDLAVFMGQVSDPAQKAALLR